MRTVTIGCRLIPIGDRLDVDYRCTLSDKDRVIGAEVIVSHDVPKLCVWIETSS